MAITSTSGRILVCGCSRRYSVAADPQRGKIRNGLGRSPRLFRKSGRAPACINICTPATNPFDTAMCSIVFRVGSVGWSKRFCNRALSETPVRIACSSEGRLCVIASKSFRLKTKSAQIFRTVPRSPQKRSVWCLSDD